MVRLSPLGVLLTLVAGCYGTTCLKYDAGKLWKPNFTELYLIDAGIKTVSSTTNCTDLCASWFCYIFDDRSYVAGKGCVEDFSKACIEHKYDEDGLPFDPVHLEKDKLRANELFAALACEDFNCDMRTSVRLFVFVSV